ncbi:MAG: sigma-70 family RNA polymerase sigma factor [Planctomycetota bacterium]|nr:sigma-70 family RNA polymerase sigma factor [Planctomycetota bacterium]
MAGCRVDEENDWVTRAKAGDREAFDKLVDLHGPAVLRYLQSLTRYSADAEDLAQEALLQAYRGLHTFKDGTDFRAWILTIGYHAWVHAKRKRKPVTLGDEEQIERIAAPEVRAESDWVETVRQGIAALPDEQRAVVQLRFGEGMSHAQIATLVGAEEATVRWRLYRARQSLQELLKTCLPERRKKRS